MLKREKQVYIVQQADMHNKFLCNALSNQLSISKNDLCSYLPDLNLKGKLMKVHVGSLSHSFSNIGYPSQKVYAHNRGKVVAQSG